MNLIKLKDILEKRISEQPIKPNVMFGSIYENLNTGEIKYPVMNIDFESVSRNANTLTYNIIVYYADRLTNNHSNDDEIKSDGVMSINLLCDTLVDDISLFIPVNINLFEQQFTDECAGAWARMMLTTTNEVDFCEALPEQYPQPIHVEQVILDKHVLSMKVGDTEQLHVSVLPNNATDKTVAWETTDEMIATVSNKGLVTAIAPGHATIIVKSNDDNTKSDDCYVAVYVEEELS